MVFPGFTKFIDPKDSQSQKMYHAEMKPRDMDTKKRSKRREPDHILDLGYAGTRLDGRKKGPPPSIDDCMLYIKGESDRALSSFATHLSTVFI